MSGREVLSVSRLPSPDAEHLGSFDAMDVLDLPALRTMERFSPTEVVHLAARTAFVDRDDRAGYDINTRGTASVVAAAIDPARPSLNRLWFAMPYHVEPGASFGRATSAARGSARHART